MIYVLNYKKNEKQTYWLLEFYFFDMLIRIFYLDIVSKIFIVFFDLLIRVLLTLKINFLHINSLFLQKIFI